ncbi:unnamed protein product [Urochloa decumbens]|uniref:Uncharacterized protein n=1 Tax=Urochloa decumbens TaxID=240449 RepID=A0ABC9FJS4_9POAL
MASSAAALRALRRLRAVPPAPALRPPSSKVPVATAAGGLLCAPRATLSPPTAPSLIRSYWSEGYAAAFGDEAVMTRREFRERLNILRQFVKDMEQQAMKDREELQAKVDDTEQEIKRHREELARSVRNLQRVGYITYAFWIGAPLLIVIGLHRTFA